MAHQSRIFLLFYLGCAIVFPDEYHYKNVLFGEKAVGMGGAFTAVADDPSAIYYNPAGIYFVRKGYLSGSGNAFAVTRQIFKDIAPSQDYELRAGGLFPSFFGLTRVVGEHHLGFGMFVLDNDYIDQNDEIINLSTVTDKPNGLSRKMLRQNTLFALGPAYAFELMENVSFGISLLGFARMDRLVDSQLITFNPVPTGKYFLQETYYAKNCFGAIPRIGILYHHNPEWQFGLTGSFNVNIVGNAMIRRTVTKQDGSGKPEVQTGSFEHDFQNINRDDLFYRP